MAELVAEWSGRLRTVLVALRALLTPERQGGPGPQPEESCSQPVYDMASAGRWSDSTAKSQQRA